VLKFQKILKFLTIALSLAVLGTMAIGAPVAAAGETAVLTPTSGAPGTVIQITGTQWGAGTVVGIQAIPHWGGTATTTTANAAGTISTTLTVPADAPTGNYTIYLSSSTGGLVALQFTVITSFTLTPSTGVVGSVANVSGGGFTAGQSVPLLWNNTTVLGTATANSAGAISANVTIPAGIRGAHTISTTGGARAGTFTLTSKITLSAASGGAGTLIGVTGTGFGASNQVSIQGITGLTTFFANTNASGGFTANFTVPNIAPRGEYTITAQDAGGAGTAVFNVIQSITVTLPAGKTKVGPGDVITISGQNFSPGTVTFKLDGVAIPGVTGTANAAGVLGDVSYTVPAIRGGAHTITVVGADLAESSGTFTVEPKISVTTAGGSASGTVGSQATVSGSGFAATSAVTITIGTTSVGTATTDSNGVFTAASITIPSVAGGNFTITARDAANNSATAPFTVTPRMSVTPTTGVYEDTITASGSGFLPGRELGFIFYRSSALYYDFPETVIIAADGTFSANLSILFVPAGSWSVKAHYTNSVDFEASASVNVTAKIVVTPVSGVKGDQINILGYGFTANKTITLKYNNAILPTTLLTTDSNGYFVLAISLPGGAAGTYVLEATDGSNTGKTDFTTLSAASLTPVTTAGAPGHVGLEVTVIGTGFKPNTDVTIRFDGTQVQLATARTASDGSFSAFFAIPAIEKGEKSILVSDGTNSRSFAFFMEGKTPDAPALAGPVNNFKPKQPVPFSWYGVADPSGVTYEFQLSLDPGFQTLLLQKSGLTSNNLLMTASDSVTIDGKVYTADKLPSAGSGSYVWRVRAVDGAGNVGAWSSVNSFNVGFSLPGWTIHLWYALGILVALILGLWLGRRMAYQSY
jgi:hypothetical protein